MLGFPNLVVTAIVIVGLSIGVSLIVLWLARRYVPQERLAPHNDVSGFAYAVIGVINAVIIAFVLVDVWDQYSDAENNARREANAVGNLHRIADGLPEPSRGQLQDATIDYVTTVIDAEWPRLRDGDTPGARELAHTNALWAAMNEVEVTTPQEEVLYAAALDQIDAVSTYRRARLADAESGVLGILWAVMIIGGSLTVLFPCLFGVGSGRMHALIIAILAASIGLLLLTVFELNHPFEGTVHIEPDGFKLVAEQFGAGRQ